MDFFGLLDTSDFPPRWECGEWSATHGWVHIVSDLLVFGAYFLIPVVLIQIVRRRRDLPFSGLFWVFALFIVACGATHLIEATIFWQPWYRLSALAKATTAVVSWAAVIGLALCVPKIVALRGPETAAEHAVRSAGEVVQKLAETSGQVLWSVGVGGAIVGDLRSWCGFTGQSESESFGLGWLDAVHPEDREQIAVLFANVDRERLSAECRLRGDSGDWRWVSIQGVRISHENQVLGHWTALATDITASKRSEDRFRRVFEAAPSAMLLVDDRGSIVLANSEAERLFGYDRQELIGRSVEILVPDHWRNVHPELRRTYAREPVSRMMGAGRELFGKHKDGHEVPLEIGLNPIETESGSGVLAGIIDISDRLAEAKRVMKSLREKEALLREIHHRVKNNLTVISSLFLLQSRHARDEETRRFLDEGQLRVQSMALVHEHLYGSEDFSEVDLSQYIDELAGQLVQTLSVDPSRVRLELEVQPVKIGIDRAIPCGLVVTELVTNALKHAFAPAGEGVIRIRLREVESEVELCVVDTGSGFDASHIDRGETLGLRVVDSLVGQIDGEVTFESTEAGTTVTLRFPQETVQASGT